MCNCLMKHAHLHSLFCYALQNEERSQAMIPLSLIERRSPHQRMRNLLLQRQRAQRKGKQVLSTEEQQRKIQVLRNHHWKLCHHKTYLAETYEQARKDRTLARTAYYDAPEDTPIRARKHASYVYGFATRNVHRLRKNLNVLQREIESVEDSLDMLRNNESA